MREVAGSLFSRRVRSFRLTHCIGELEQAVVLRCTVLKLLEQPVDQ